MAKPVISKVVLKIGETEVSMTVDEAKKLMKILTEAFGEKEERTVYIPYPCPTVEPWPYGPWRITWHDNGYYGTDVGNTLTLTYTNSNTRSNSPRT